MASASAAALEESSSSIRQPLRNHGFERPLHPLQVLSWFVFGFDVLLFCLVILPLVDPVAAKALISVGFSFTAVVLVAATIKATAANPADRLEYRSTCALSDEVLPYCTECNMPQLTRSKHCRVCNKCVHVFDHHCMWLNTCIGAANYKAFRLAISSVVAMVGIVVGTCIYLIVDVFAYGDGFEERRHKLDFLNAAPKEVIVLIYIIMAAFNLPLFVLDLQLVILHAILASHNLTTYDYIINKRFAQEGGLPPQLGQAFVALPSCIDWIVFARCGGRRRGSAHGGKTTVVHIYPNDEAEDSQPSWADSSKGSNRGCLGRASCAVGMTPPGSFVDEFDSTAALDEAASLEPLPVVVGSPREKEELTERGEMLAPTGVISEGIGCGTESPGSAQTQSVLTAKV